VIQLKVYLDYVFFINFFFDFILLFGTSKILKKILSIKRLLIGSFLGSLSILFLFIPLATFTLLILKFLLSILIILATFGKKELFKNLFYFYLLSIILGGGLYLFDINLTFQNNHILTNQNSLGIHFLIILLASPLLIYIFIKENITYKNIYQDHYIVSIYIDGKEYKVEGMIDTGNQLVDPYKKRSVILVDLDIDISKKKFIYVPFKALNTNGIIPCICPERVIVKDKIFSNCLIGLSKDKFTLDGASCILPNQFKEELL